MLMPSVDVTQFWYAVNIGTFTHRHLRKNGCCFSIPLSMHTHKPAHPRTIPHMPACACMCHIHAYRQENDKSQSAGYIIANVLMGAIQFSTQDVPVSFSRTLQEFSRSINTSPDVFGEIMSGETDNDRECSLWKAGHEKIFLSNWRYENFRRIIDESNLPCPVCIDQMSQPSFLMGKRRVVCPCHNGHKAPGCQCTGNPSSRRRASACHLMWESFSHNMPGNYKTLPGLRT